MCRKVLGVWLALLLLHSNALTAAQFAFRVTFTDKNNAPYSLSSPLSYLSPRAIARRTSQGIAIDSTDIPVDPAYLDSIVTLTHGKLHGSSRWLNECVVLLTDSTQILNLSGKPFISNIKLVGYFSSNLHRTKARTIQSPPAASRTTDAAYYGMTWSQTHIVNGDYLHDRGYKGQGKLIAVLDAGFIGTNATHGFDSLYMSGRLVDTFNFNSNNGNIYVSDVHGTQVLSNLAGYVPGTYVGSAPLAMYALYVTDYEPGDQPMEMDNMLFASERADSIGADVISESLGYDLFDYPAGSGQDFSELDGHTTIAAKAANMATKKGMLFVATAGNDGASIPGWGTHILTPGDADSALTIGAVSESGAIAGFSGYGPNAAEVVKPDVCGMGISAYSFDASGYLTPSGTSISTPQIAGFAACLWQANPASKPCQLKQAIIKCASSYSSPGQQLGYGIPNFQCTSEILEVLDTPPPFTSGNWVIVHPNPVGNVLILSVSPDAEQYVHFRVVDMTGRTHASFSRYLFKGTNVPIKLDVLGMVPGLYMLEASSATQKQVLKLQKL